MATIHKLTHTGNILLIGFAGMLVMMSILVYLSIRQDVSMVSHNYYEQELLFQQRAEAIKNTRPYRDSFAVRETQGAYAVEIPKSLSAGLDSGSLYFYAPSNEHHDRIEYLKKGQDIYRIEKSGLPSSHYVLKITIWAPTGQYYKEIKLH